MALFYLIGGRVSAPGELEYVPIGTNQHMTSQKKKGVATPTFVSVSVIIVISGVCYDLSRDCNLAPLFKRRYSVILYIFYLYSHRFEKNLNICVSRPTLCCVWYSSWPFTRFFLRLGMMYIEGFQLEFRVCSPGEFWLYISMSTWSQKKSSSSNEVRDILGSLLGTVCRDVALEPTLQLLSGEILHGKCVSRDHEAWLDIRANGFWGNTFQKTFFDVRVFNANSPSYRNTNVAACYKRQLRTRETEKICMSSAFHR